MRTLLLFALFPLALSGCLNQAQPQALDPSPATGPGAAPSPVTVTWTGHILTSPTGMLAHNRATEPLVMPVQKEGFVFEITEPPQSLQALLHWPGPGSALIMVSTPHKEGKGFEYFTKPSSEKSLCLQIPPAEIEPGRWQIMIHTSDSVNADFTFEVTTVGGASKILLGEPHSSAEAAETQERAALPCEPPSAQ